MAEGAVDYGVLPVENTLAGSVAPVYDVLVSSGLAVVGEIVCAIELYLMAPRGSSLEQVRRALSHPVALAQCSRFFQEHPSIEAVAVHDTAGAARLAAERGDASVGAVAGRAAAERYGLDVLAEHLQDRPDNQTRFLIVARRDAVAPPREVTGGNRGGWKTVLSAETTNTPGALVALLRPFAEHGINLAHLECRPGETPWTYRFVLEVEAEGNAGDARAALEKARAASETFHVLGTFPRAAARR